MNAPEAETAGGYRSKENLRLRSLNTGKNLHLAIFPRHKITPSATTKKRRDHPKDATFSLHMPPPGKAMAQLRRLISNPLVVVQNVPSGINNP